MRGKVPDATVGQRVLFIPGHSLDYILTFGKFHACEGAYHRIVRLCCPGFLSVDVKRHRTAVAEHGDIRRFPATALGSLPGYIDHRFGIPVGAIEIIRVFLCLAVVGHEALVVYAVAVAFGAVSGSEVKHVPHETSPYKRAAADYAPVLYMVDELPVFRMPAARGHRLHHTVLLMAHARARAILADTYAQFRVIAMGGVEPSGESGGCRAISSVIAVPRYIVGDEIESASLIACRGGGARGILGVGHDIEFLHVFHRIVTGLLELVEEPPEHD